MQRGELIPRKLSESRGVKLPLIDPSSKLNSANENFVRRQNTKRVSYSEETTFIRPTTLNAFESSPCSPCTPTPSFVNSPVGHSLRHVQETGRYSPKRLPGAQNSCVNITIYLSDRTGFKFSVIDGKIATASQVLLLVSSHLGIEMDLLKECCSLWMVSNLLEVQLKPHHIPYEVHKNWAYLLERFTVERNDKDIDEPIIILRRNVFLCVEREIELEDISKKLTEILYLNAKQEWLDGRYPCPFESCIHLAALQLSIDLGVFNPSEHTTIFISDSIDKYLPIQYRNRSKTVYLFGVAVMGCRGIENDILQHLKSFSLLDNHEKRKQFLSILRDLPYYGAAFFKGYVERSPAESLKNIKRMILAATMPEVEVIVGINLNYIFMIDASNRDVLLVLSIFDCIWRRIDNFSQQGRSNDKEMSSILLYFPDSNDFDKSLSVTEDEIGTSKHNKLLQVLSRQSIMIEALMISLRKKVIHKIENPLNEVDSEASVASVVRDYDLGDIKHIDEDVAAYECGSDSPTILTQKTASTRTQPQITVENNVSQRKQFSRQHSLSPSLSSFTDKLCFATFDGDGRCVDARGSLKRFLQTS